MFWLSSCGAILIDGNTEVNIYIINSSLSIRTVLHAKRKLRDSVFIKLYLSLISKD